MKPHSLRKLLILLSITTTHTFQTPLTKRQPKLQMGILDFFSTRQNDFVKLDKSSQESIGPGPLIVLYNIPNGIDDEELSMMIQDGAPNASRDNLGFIRVYPDDIRNGYLANKSVLQVLETLLPISTRINNPTKTPSNAIIDENVSPILYFSGTSNNEMMSTYNIIAREIYEETGGNMNAACAKVVQPAFEKGFCQLIDEISGDHRDALGQSGDV